MRSPSSARRAIRIRLTPGTGRWRTPTWPLRATRGRHREMSPSIARREHSMTVEKLVPRNRAQARRQLIRAAIALSVLSIAVLAAGCGGSDDETALPAEQVEAFASPYCVTARTWAVHELDGGGDGAYARGGPAGTEEVVGRAARLLEDVASAGAARGSRGRGDQRARDPNSIDAAPREVRLRLSARLDRSRSVGTRLRRPSTARGCERAGGPKPVPEQGLRLRGFASRGGGRVHEVRGGEALLRSGGRTRGRASRQVASSGFDPERSGRT